MRDERLIRTRRSISLPIAVGILAVALSIALLVGWILVIVQDRYLTWLLALGSASFVVVITVLVLFSVFLAREIRLVNRQSQFIDSVTHELRSPLASLKLCLETLARKDLPAGEGLRVRQMMTDDVERLSIFIDDVLEASRLSHSREGYSLEDVALRPLVANCVERVSRYYKQLPEAIRIKIPGDLVLVSDRVALEIVIKNLIDNALKYSLGEDRPVEVSIEARRVGDDVHVQIRDHGVGIPKKHQSRIFERFYRVPGEAGRARHGTGLGLFVAFSLVRILGGKLRAKSEGAGHGTTMHIRIPMRTRERTELPVKTPSPAIQDQ